MSVKVFDWTQEINQVITRSLVTTFGLDFLLLEDKKGGDVDTVYNVRQGIWATVEEKQKYINREEYNSDAYHQDVNYIKKGHQDKKLQQEGSLKDHYRKNKNLGSKDKRDLDHVISAYEIHNDAGRILAELDGVVLANKDSNLFSTVSSINRTKKQYSVDKFLQNLPQTIKNREVELSKLEHKCKTMLQDTPQQKHLYQQLQDKIRKKQQALDELKQTDQHGMRKVDQEARANNEKYINTYYQSTKFFKNSFEAAKVKGLNMGLRESVGLILAEIWFEFKENIPTLLKKYKNIEFKISIFFKDLQDILINIVERVKVRFKDIVEHFMESALSGFFASLTTTIINIFLTTAKLWGKIIRESWLNIVNVTKLVFFNPENLTTGQLTKATFKILSASVGLLLGMVVNESLVCLKTLPLGNEISTFISALSSGIVILGLNYFIEQNQTMQKFWVYLDQIKNKYEKVLDHFKEINIELDRYVLELTQLEFGIDINQLSIFARNLSSATDEMERNIILKQEIEKQSIKLPLEMGNVESTQNWLLGLARK
ncbi:DNA repair protein [Acinetobacter baumannii]|uniref:DNA repair protein n=1 Tax=Acinetobacter baumannii TaxID=470 RepID=UPI002342500E|nr:DNA repair protein [Acinetobacter baumannii]MDC5317580.1 DNA repair protein [Acinetobacter baumannii]